ncbi:hypothetical protein HGRIS_010513 [Hohenbuehelia grisea]|uniref:Uncharacterized protein n=1 Tax=Hohenbuehelia grisea TaxID=104357 RepID=A0ABR3IX96_9AGAR
MYNHSLTFHRHIRPHRHHLTVGRTRRETVLVHRDRVQSHFPVIIHYAALFPSSNSDDSQFASTIRFLRQSLLEDGLILCDDKVHNLKRISCTLGIGFSSCSSPIA